MALLPADETASLLPSSDAGDPIGTFAHRLADFQQAADDAAAAGTQIDDVWVACRHATDGWKRRSSWLDRTAAERFCDGIVHIELVFVNRLSQVRIAYTVDKPDPRDTASGFVRMVAPDPRQTYPTPLWTVHRVSSLRPAEIYGMLAFCQRQVGKPFNYGMYWNFVPLVGPLIAGEPLIEEPHYFCSQLVAAALRWVRPWMALNPRRCTPALLHRLLGADSAADNLTIFFRPVDTFTV